MKRMLYLAAGLTAAVSSAQTAKQVEFTKKLNYRIEATPGNADGFDTEYEKVSYDHYVGKNAKESLLSFYYNDASVNSYASESNFYVKNNWMIPVSVGGISKSITYTAYSAFKVLEDNKTFVKLDRKGTLNGLNCQYYAVLSDASDKESYDYCMCIDESNKTNNAESLFPDAKVKGLVLLVEPKDNQYRLVYKSAENATLKLDIEADKMLTEVEEYQAQIMADTLAVAEVAAPDYATAVAAGDMYSDPLYTYAYDNEDMDYSLYNFMSPVYGVTSTALYNTKEYNGEGSVERKQIAKFFEKESKSLVKNLSSAKLITADQKKTLQKYFKEQNKKVKEYSVAGGAAVDAATAVAAVDYADYAGVVADSAAYADDYSYYTKYEPVYNDIQKADVSLAYDILDNEQLKENAPSYCDGLKERVPNFQNKDLKHHVYNLTGQICDLYLYNNGGNVDYFLTLNEMRKSMLEIEKLRSSLSQKDQKSLLEFLKSLD